jgi:hypothetical protein
MQNANCSADGLFPRVTLVSPAGLVSLAVVWFCPYVTHYHLWSRNARPPLRALKNFFVEDHAVYVQIRMTHAATNAAMLHRQGIRSNMHWLLCSVRCALQRLSLSLPACPNCLDLCECKHTSKMIPSCTVNRITIILLYPLLQSTRLPVGKSTQTVERALHSCC